MNTKTKSHHVKPVAGVERINNILCPDGQRRQFYVNGTVNGHKRGWVQAKGVSVAGYAKAVGVGFRFFPHMESKNIHLVRPECLEPGTVVQVNETGMTGVILEVADWSYLTPRYKVRLKGLGKGNHKPVLVSEDDLTVV